MIFVPWDFFSVVRIKSTLPTGLPSSKGVVITLTILFNQIRKHHLSFKKTISNKNIITTQETVNHNTEYRISFRAEFPNRFFSHGSISPTEGVTNLNRRQIETHFCKRKPLAFRAPISETNPHMFYLCEPI